MKLSMCNKFSVFTLNEPTRTKDGEYDKDVGRH